MTREADKYLQKAGHALTVAEDLLGHGHTPDAASKIYYAMFYAAQALLKNAGIEVIKHSAVESAFGYYFVKPGKIDPKYHKMLIGARKIREIADYDIQTEVIEPAALLKVEDGKAFITAIKSAIDAHDKTGDYDAPQ